MNALRTRIALMGKRGDRGDQAVSYLGIVVLLVLVAAVLFQMRVHDKIRKAVQMQIEKVTNGSPAPSEPSTGNPPSDGKKAGQDD